MNIKIQLIYFFFVIPQIWCFSQNTEFEEFDKVYNLAYTSNSDSALQYAFIALEIGKKLNNDSLAASAQVAISYSYNSLGNYTSALNYALKAEPFFKKAKSTAGYTVLFMQIAGIYLNLNNPELAIVYYRKALGLKTKEIGLVIPLNMNLGEAYRKLEQFDSALYYYKKVELLSSECNMEIFSGYILCNIGLVYAAQGKNQEADSLIKRSFQILETQKDFRPIAETYRELAKIALKNNEIEKAYNYATQAYQIADSNQLVVELKETSLLLSQLNGEKGNFKDAFTYLTAFNDYNQKVASDSVVSKLAEMRAEFEISQNETEMSYLKKISKVRTNLLFVALLGILAIGALAFYLLHLSRMLKLSNHQLSEFNEELTQKNHIIDMALIEKEMLMKEIHHRVKNNLQIISSIINLQKARLDDPAIIDLFNEMQRRILAIAAIHQKLYQGNSVTVINMKDYIEDVVESLHASINNDSLNVACEISIQNIEADIDTAVALGLIVNELVTNAYKYAFEPKRTNSLTITLVKTPENRFELTLHDNGPGIPEGFTFENSDSLGLRMVSLLIRQHNGSLNYFNDLGTRYEIVF